MITILYRKLMKKIIFLIVVAVGLFAAAEAQTTTIEKVLLNDIEHGEPWPCLYYELNNNADLEMAVGAGWMNPDEDESYWQTGVGPFSNDQNKFFITDWASELHPLLVRRHFTLSAEDIANMDNTTVTMRCSYDEDPVIYLNGTRITGYTGWNDNNYASYTFTKSKRALFVEGDNVLAVSLKQGAGGGHIDYSLTMKVKVTDGIEEVEIDSEDSPSVYTLNGQKINNGKLPKGVFIVNNKTTINH